MVDCITKLELGVGGLFKTLLEYCKLSIEEKDE